MKAFRVAVLLSGVMLLSSCTKNGTEPPREWVHVTIKNETGLPAALYRVDRDDHSLVASLGNARARRIKLASGIYFAEIKTERAEPVRIAIPALKFLGDAEFQVQLKMPPELPPETEGDWCWIPEGPAVIGDTIGIGQEDERPARRLDLPAFWLGKFEVTNREYAEFLNAQPELDSGWIDLESRKCRIKENRESRYESDAPRLPVVMVSLAGARAYCDWKTKLTGIRHRLPSEAEWEKAARGPESYVFAYGNTYRQDAANQESGTLKPVGNFAPNGFGLYDITGNAFEWVADQYDRDSEGEPMLRQMMRGGSYVLDGMYLRNSFRMRQSRTLMTDDVGFRVVREFNEKENAP